MSSHQKGAGIADFVGPLLKRLNLAKERVAENSEMETLIDQISTVVVKTKDIVDNRENLDKELVGYLGKIERQIDPLMDLKPRAKASDLPHKVTITEVGQSSNQGYQMDENSKFQKLRKSLNKNLRKLLDSLAVIPKNAEVKKRFLIYYWTPYYWYTEYERIFSDLVDKNILIPVHREHNKVMDRFTIEPTLHKWLISKSKGDHRAISKKREEGNWCLYRDNIFEIDFKDVVAVLNVGQRYLCSKDIIHISNKYVTLVVYQLGSWHYTTEVQNGVKQTGSKETRSKDHIEVDQTDFLNKLGELVYYLSLRGISGIAELPQSIGKLEYLVILDLRACHNLEKLPQKPEGTWFVNLEVLDISECYQLDYMPKWICELTKLEVLKGFVVGSTGNKEQPCHLSDLLKLKKLWKLSIRITIDILSPEVFQGFNSLKSLLVLIIIWRQNKEIPTYPLPKNLEKLDIRCYPEAEVLSKLQNPEELTNLKRLYIRGGNLTKIPCHDSWNVEILRLRFLNKLVYPTDWEELRSSFKNLKYVEYVGCTKPNNFPNNGSSWYNEE